MIFFDLTGCRRSGRLGGRENRQFRLCERR